MALGGCFSCMEDSRIFSLYFVVLSFTTTSLGLDVDFFVISPFGVFTSFYLDKSGIPSVTQPTLCGAAGWSHSMLCLKHTRSWSSWSWRLFLGQPWWSVLIALSRSPLCWEVRLFSMDRQGLHSCGDWEAGAQEHCQGVLAGRLPTQLPGSTAEDSQELDLCLPCGSCPSPAQSFA